MRAKMSYMIDGKEAEMNAQTKVKIREGFKRVFLGEYTLKENVVIEGTRVRYAIYNKSGRLIGGISEKTYSENADEIEKLMEKARLLAAKELAWQEERDAELAKREETLRAKLPAIPEAPGGDPDPTREEEIKAKIEELKGEAERFMGDPESSGILLGIESQIGRLHKELQTYCDHEIKVEYSREWLSGTSVMVVSRRVYCPKCGWEHVDSVHEELPESVVWR